MIFCKFYIRVEVKTTMAGVKSFGSPGKQDVPNTLWIGVRDGDPGPIMLAREKPEAFKLKVI